MTTERAIELLKRISDSQFDGEYGDERREALEMAVRALEDDGDTISRQQAIDALDDIESEVADGFGFQYEKWRKHFADLPSAQPQRKKGKWIKLDMHAHIADHKCTACGEECYVPTCMGEPMYTYCPNCGADMRGEQDEHND